MLNRADIIGNLTHDPEIRFTQSGTAVATLSVATNRKWKDKEGQQQEEVEYHRVVAWDKTASFCGDYLKKGQKVYCCGRLKTRSWEDQSGVKKYTTEIVAQTVQSLTPKSDSGQGGGYQDSPMGGAYGTGGDVPFGPIF